MEGKPRERTLFAAALGLFKSKPVRTDARTVRKSNASPAARKIARKKTPASASDPHAHKSASITCGGGACGAARELEGVRFLLRDVQLFPLADCTSPNCTCSYERHQDRRWWGGDRRALFSLNSDLHTIGGDTERRKKHSRRSSDDDNFAASDADFDIAQWEK
ncbi:MAG: hypothetical protein V7700_08105 [Halioglobus sp.]